MTDYDIIGDIHGYADQLEKLLTVLGYKEVHGVHRHPERRVVFLGDFIDRGPKIRRTLEIAYAMVQDGSALAVLGNHEFNALCYHTEINKGVWLRAHDEKNIRQHAATLDAFFEDYKEWEKYLAWFSELPLYLDLGSFRAVHAAWIDKHIKTVSSVTRLDLPFLQAAATPGSGEYNAIEAILKGPEFRLEGVKIKDKEGHPRGEVRLKWWCDARGQRLRDMAFPSSTAPQVPDITIPERYDSALCCENDKPVFFGHYWLPPGTPLAPVDKQAFCLDYSVAQGGSLAAYRVGPHVIDGEFVAVNAGDLSWCATPPREAKRLG